MNSAHVAAPVSAKPLYCEPQALPRALTYRQTVTIAARSYLVQLLDECGGNVAETARRADLNREHLYVIFKRLGLRTEQPTRRAPTPLPFRQWLKAPSNPGL
jgi:transcriptional regulator with GAF, ATPase, and Fis domain